MAPTDSDGALPRMDLTRTTAKRLKTVAPLRIAESWSISLLELDNEVHPVNTKPSTSDSFPLPFPTMSKKYVGDWISWKPIPRVHSTTPEDLHPPAFAAFQTVPASKDQASQSPMVVVEDQCVWGSDTILQQFCSDPETINLYPKEIQEEVKQLEEELNTRLGATARCFGYSILLDKSKKYYGVATQFLTRHCPTIEQKIWGKMLDKGLDKGMIRVMNVEQFGTTSEQEIRKIFDEMSEKLEANGGEYLMDTKDKRYGFTAADLSLAALSYFVLCPPEMAPFLVPEKDNAPEMVKLGNDLRATLAGKHVLRMYKEHRPVNAGTKEIEVKKVDQNYTPWKEVAGVVAAIGAVLYGVLSMKS